MCKVHIIILYTASRSFICFLISMLALLADPGGDYPDADLDDGNPDADPDKTQIHADELTGSYDMHALFK